MAPFGHFLLTRFNVRTRFAEGAPVCEPAWLDARFDLFERFCLPSVRAQTVAGFRWLCFFDAGTPDAFRARIDRCAEGDAFEAVFVEGAFGPERILEAVRTRVRPGATHVITSRLDNDDAISRDYVEQVQATFRGQDVEVVNLAAGYCWHRGRIYLRRVPRGPFVSLVERVAGLRTIHGGRHADAATLGPVRQLDDRPSWIQVIHGGNVSNRLRGERRPIGELGDRFALGFDPAARGESRLGLALARLGRPLRRLARGSR
ncbi:MAG: glycosyltransferase [Planctomycetota bacterium]|jgi:hypothetical protein